MAQTRGDLSVVVADWISRVLADLSIAVVEWISRVMADLSITVADLESDRLGDGPENEVTQGQNG